MVVMESLAEQNLPLKRVHVRSLLCFSADGGMFNAQIFSQMRGFVMGGWSKYKQLFMSSILRYQYMKIVY